MSGSRTWTRMWTMFHGWGTVAARGLSREELGRGRFCHGGLWRHGKPAPAVSIRSREKFVKSFRLGVADGLAIRRDWKVDMVHSTWNAR